MAREIVVRGDTVGVRAVIHNSTTSLESLLRYVVDVPGGVSAIQTPLPTMLWDAVTKVGDRPVASWTTGELIAPGASSPDLYFESVGLPAVATYWAGGDYQYPSYDSGENSDTVTFADPLAKAMVAGKAIGVEPWLGARTASALLARLRLVTTSVCNAPLTWISNGDLCVQLLADLDQAEVYRAAGQQSDARGTLAHYKGLLEGPQPGTFASGVNSSGYWLLKANADIVIGLLN